MDTSVVSGMNESVSSVKQTAAAMDSLFGVSDSTMALLNTASAMMQIANGGAQLITLAITAKESLNTILAARAVAGTTANALVPGVGWGKIALAVAAAGSGITRYRYDHELYSSENLNFVWGRNLYQVIIRGWYERG